MNDMLVIAEHKGDNIRKKSRLHKTSRRQDLSSSVPPNWLFWKNNQNKFSPRDRLEWLNTPYQGSVERIHAIVAANKDAGATIFNYGIVGDFLDNSSIY